MTWLREEDRSTSHFHKIASGRRRANITTLAMLGLSDDANTGAMKRLIIDDLTTRFQSSSDIHVESWEACFPHMDRKEAESLELSFYPRRRFYRELMGLNGNKALGPYDFSYKLSGRY